MAGMSNYLQNKLIDHVFRATSYTMPTDLRVGIHTVTPTAAGGGTEVSYTGYTRAVLTPNISAPTNWTSTQGLTTAVASSGTTGQTSNNLGGVGFGSGNIAGLGSAITVVGFGIYDASGNLLFYGTLTNPKTLNNGDPVPIIQTGGITITIGN